MSDHFDCSDVVIISYSDRYVFGKRVLFPVSVWSPHMGYFFDQRIDCADQESMKTKCLARCDIRNHKVLYKYIDTSLSPFPRIKKTNPISTIIHKP